MLVEKKSLRRFLLIYLLSTFFLLGIGSFFYYEMSYQSLEEKQTLLMKENIETFILNNQQKHIFHSKQKPDYQDIPVAIYFDKVYQFGNFKPATLYFEKEHFLDATKLYYLKKEHKRWGVVYFVTYKDIKDKVQILQKNIALFLLFSILFIVFVALVLGKIFIRPMKETINALENFIADATHEINTPISNILINIEMAKVLDPQIEESQEYQKIERSALRLSKIFKDLSFLSLHHHPKRDRELLDLDTLLEERISFFDSFIQNKKLLLKKESKKREIKADREAMIRMIDNLLSNAIKYTPSNGEIEISLKKCLEITNTGSIKDAKSIVKKFHRENRSEGGFGLGLYIVQKICTEYQFDFSIKSEDGKVHVRVCMGE